LGKTWVLDTETKGTGAEMVPLEKVQNESARRGGRPVSTPKPRPWSAARPAPRQRRRFKVIEAATQRVLTDDAHARATVDLLAGIRSVAGVWIFVWQPKAKDWRLLTLSEKRVLWKFSRLDIVSATAPGSR
jgi:hypothetical protein